MRCISLFSWLAAISIVQAAEPLVTPSSAPPSEPLSVWFTAPARVLPKARVAIAESGTKSELASEGRRYDFLESLPLGNGRLGAMDCGGVDLERVVLNENSVWSGGDYDGN